MELSTTVARRADTKTRTESGGDDKFFAGKQDTQMTPLALFIQRRAGAHGPSLPSVLLTRNVGPATGGREHCPPSRKPPGYGVLEQSTASPVHVKGSAHLLPFVCVLFKAFSNEDP
jgi:hypothetical protein